MKPAELWMPEGYPPRRSPCAMEGRAATPWITSTRQPFHVIVTGVSQLS